MTRSHHRAPGADITGHRLHLLMTSPSIAQVPRLTDGPTTIITSPGRWSLTRARLGALAGRYQLHTHPLADRVTPANQFLPLSICLSQQVLQPGQLLLKEFALLLCMGCSSWQLLKPCGEHSIKIRPGSPSNILLLGLYQQERASMRNFTSSPVTKHPSYPYCL